jgi:Type II secretory pathway, component PulF
MVNQTLASPAPQRAPKRSWTQVEIFGSSVKRDDLMHLSRQLGAFVQAGVPIIDAVRILAEESRRPALRTTMRDIEERLRGGERLSDAIGNHPKVFPPYYRAIIQSAELTGRLDTVLEQLARYLERDLEARRKISSALTYPLVIAAMSVVTVVILAGFVLPKFRVFFSDLGADLPLTTRILINITDFLLAWWWALVGGVAGLLLLGALVGATPGGRVLRDRLVLGLPVIGQTVKIALIERFCRVLGSMAAAGVALPDALRVATQSLRNRIFIRELDRVGEAMLRGEGLARPLGTVKLFPGTAVRMIRVGEETGTLDQQLHVTAHYYEVELDHRLKRLTAIFEPAVLIVMGLIVGFVAVAMVGAMYGIFDQVEF